MTTKDRKMIQAGIAVADSKLYKEDKIWSRYSHDKVDIGERLGCVIRTLFKEFRLHAPLTAISIGSSNEPQFRILEAVFRGGLYLLDIEKEALGIIKERIKRQSLDHIKPLVGDYNKIFSEPERALRFLKQSLDRKRMNLVAFHHSLYYCQEPKWNELFENLFHIVLAPKGAMHVVMMSAKTSDEYTTSWLYGHFAGKFFGCHNDQDLNKFKSELERDHTFRKTQILIKRSRVRFFVDDFTEFMAVIWMILLYPGVHKYNEKQKEEIAEFIYKKFWLTKKPLVQEQDHLVIYRGIAFKGLL